MARIVENDKGFKIIAFTIEDSIKINFGILPGICLCMGCNEPIKGDIYYIAVLNDVMCEKHYKDFVENNKPYAEDTRYENRNFEYYAKQFNLI